MNKDIRQVEGGQFPPQLKTIPDPPKELWQRGVGLDSSAFHLAGIGSREATAGAIKKMDLLLQGVFNIFSQYFPEQFLATVSGAALGTDTQVTRTSLNADIPTVATLFTPINRMWPAKNLPLILEIIEKNRFGNAVISENPSISAPYVLTKNHQAPKRRNRIITGLSKAVVVAGLYSLESGTHNAVWHAVKQDRPIFLIRGTISSGVRDVFVRKYGATEVSTAKELLDQLAPLITE